MYILQTNYITRNNTLKSLELKKRQDSVTSMSLLTRITDYVRIGHKLSKISNQENN